MKFTSTEATPAPHVPPGVLRLTGAAKEDIPMYRIQTMNKISPVGLNRFPSELYEVGDAVQDPQGILVRSAKLLDLEFNPSLLAIARAGVGVNNIPLDRCAAAGIPVFSTPGANANAVKELVICAMLMGSRDIPGAIRWVREQAASGVDVSTVVEKGKSAFIGPELYKKTLGIIGLGAIGSIVANTAISLGMDVYGYDPFLSVDTALRLDRHVHVVKDINDLYKRSDYITMHIHYTEKTAHMIDADAIAAMKRGVRVINLARGEIVDDEAMLTALDTGMVAAYITDFPNNHPGKRAELRRHGSRYTAGLSGKRQHPLQRESTGDDHGPQRCPAAVRPAQERPRHAGKHHQSVWPGRRQRGKSEQQVPWGLRLYHGGPWQQGG